MTIAVIGGGASGLMAALTAAGRGTDRIILAERQSRVGRKLMATGNGRCNLSNKSAAPESYHGGGADFVRPALEAFGPEKTREYFASLGLLTVCEDSGRVYPLSDQANSVVDVLRLAAEGTGVEIHTGCEVRSVEKRADGFVIECGELKFSSDRLIIACGGAAGASLGGVMCGYDLLSSLGHSRTKLYPSLVQLRTDNTWTRPLKGVRADAAVELIRNGRKAAASEGEVQFTDYGVSGPAVFEISRAASPEGGGLEVRLDLVRGYTEKELVNIILNRVYTMPMLTMENLLTGMLHNRLGRVIVRRCGFKLEQPVAGMAYRDARAIAECIKGFVLTVNGTMGIGDAQVTAGGMCTSEFDPETLASRICPGLFACGEVLDIDGDCGGFNLQWAWSSGRLAGMTGRPF